MKKGEPIKNWYNRESLGEFARSIQSVRSSFPADDFVEAVIDESWDGLELKARMRQISMKLGEHLPKDYEAAIAVLDQVAASYKETIFGIIFPDFVEVYGQDVDDWDTSIPALERYTQYSSSEFAVRPFIINHEERMMAQMRAWAQHENEHVRRLASEGCRPALPWGQALTSFKQDPSPVLPILEQLKTDPSAYVRKSVANNLNDISKTLPELVTKLAKSWRGKSKDTDWIVKHGCRTLLKRGNREVLAIFGFHDGSSLELNDFALSFKDGADFAHIGEDMNFAFSVRASEPTKLRLEYGIDFVKANGKQSRKVFQISESELKADEVRSYDKKHSFADLSTRKHYSGTHSITLIVNGAERERIDFELCS
jgi:3-methyladenine DNA glycosylase AlkC